MDGVLEQRLNENVPFRIVDDEGSYHRSFGREQDLYNVFIAHYSSPEFKSLHLQDFENNKPRFSELRFVSPSVSSDHKIKICLLAPVGGVHSKLEEKNISYYQTPLIAVSIFSNFPELPKRRFINVGIFKTQFDGLIPHTKILSFLEQYAQYRKYGFRVSPES